MQFDLLIANRLTSTFKHGVRSLRSKMANRQKLAAGMVQNMDWTVLAGWLDWADLTGAKSLSSKEPIDTIYNLLFVDT